MPDPEYIDSLWPLLSRSPWPVDRGDREDESESRKTRSEVSRDRSSSKVSHSNPPHRYQEIVGRSFIDAR